MRFLICTLSLALFVSHYEAKDLVVGNRVNNLLVATEKFYYNALPLLRRDTDYTYQDPYRRIIKVDNALATLRMLRVSMGDGIAYHQGIIARDLSRTDAMATVTEGGVGHNHVTIHLQSERGKGLNYLILVFTKNS